MDERATRTPKFNHPKTPIRFTYEENYFITKYQGIPKDGYGKMVENMLDGIEVQLGVDFFDMKNNWQDFANHLVYTGPIDKFFNYEYGELEYNTLRFEHRLHQGDFQGTQYSITLTSLCHTFGALNTSTFISVAPSMSR